MCTEKVSRKKLRSLIRCNDHLPLSEGKFLLISVSLSLLSKFSSVPLRTVAKKYHGLESQSCAKAAALEKGGGIESRELSQLDEQKKKLKSTENGFVRIRAENTPNDKKS